MYRHTPTPYSTDARSVSRRPGAPRSAGALHRDLFGDVALLVDLLTADLDVVARPDHRAPVRTGQHDGDELGAGRIVDLRRVAVGDVGDGRLHRGIDLDDVPLGLDIFD